jgi:pantoate--beta-alanine ligase
MQAYAETARLKRQTLALVPTMGALHKGHLSLVEMAKSYADVTILSIFVNPLQFGPSEDFEKYPRDFDLDEKLAESAGVDILFYPTKEDLYPDNYFSYVCVDSLTNYFEGDIRPDHFKGVTTIVCKLFNITKPHVAVFGQKDAQQLAILRKMTADLNFDIKIVGAPIVRENDGLAMSSRNVYLSNDERSQATVLYDTIDLVKEKLKGGLDNSHELLEMAKSNLSKASLGIIDYIQVVDATTFKPAEKLQKGNEYIFILAVKFGSTRLLDNYHFTL